ncbi:hypothetical protein [Algibacillus agarilyticus]|uniref:hypothetical protein n=1 Tax=Algibacillus agarilyticus TaxID=2234133 RepID=UPI000DD0E247|nr:hypothetical protein [Algibacillus agarilyticus]
MSGILVEVTKVNKLLDFKFLYKNVLVPTINLGVDRGYLNKDEAKVLNMGISKQKFKANELDDAFDGLTSRQKTHLIPKMKDSGFRKRTIHPIYSQSDRVLGAAVKLRDPMSICSTM